MTLSPRQSISEIKSSLLKSQRVRGTSIDEDTLSSIVWLSKINGSNKPKQVIEVEIKNALKNDQLDPTLSHLINKTDI